MRKIKVKPFNPAKYKIPKGAEVVYFYPIEYAYYSQEQADKHSWELAKQRMWARLRGETPPSVADYVGGNWHDL